MINKKLSDKSREDLIITLKARFEKHMYRHEGIEWNDVLNKLDSDPEKLWSLGEMERTGGEPDVVSIDVKSSGYVFFDCSEESPKGRRSLCYDRNALDGRKENKPANSVLDMASEMGIELLSEDQYRELQKFGKFDTKTSSWVKTTENIRELGGALFCDRRYETLFTYHNGAESYYAARGFRGLIKI